MRAAQLSKSLGRGVAKACLDGQTKDTMAHYVKMVVRGCDRSGWPMRRVFIKHLAQVASRSIKAGDVAGSSKASECLAEFGNVGGWKYVVTWLGEKPDVNKWPSGAVLDQLGTCLTAKAPVQLFALLHAALTSSSFNFSARSLGRLERIMAKAVAPAFQLQTLEQSLALVREVAACGRVKDRFQFVLHLMDFALEIKQEMDTQKSSRWTEMQQKLQGFLACPRVQGKVSKDSWQALAALEDDLMDTLKNTIDQHLQSSKEHEQSLEEKQQQQFEKDTLAKMDQDRQVIWSLLHEGELKEKHKAGLQKCLGRIRSMYELMQKVEPTRPCLEAWDAARAAVQSYGEMPVRCTKAFQWLQRKQLGHLGSLLDSAGLLEHLHRLGDADFGQGFPLRGRQLLLAAVEADALSKDDLKPKLDEVPEGWEQRTSRHLNLQYFQSLEAAGKMQWEWPLPKKLLPWRKGPDATDHLCQQRDEDSLLSEHKKTLSGPKGRRPYLEGQRCLLCMRDADDIHMASREHSQQMMYWKQLSDRLAMVCLDFRKVSHQDKPQTGLTTAWRGELWQALKVDPSPPRRVLAVFWLRAVLPQLAAPTPSHDTTTGLQALLDEAFTAASEMPKVDAMVVEKAQGA
ncbi:unnamed protein product [Effrenium voratum]|uniref:Uncharacterized protein n=1 Tax=Effrenium voratum TaxID=2562239 RepID=A0AA36JCL7_9DINO|nr:unnamed protein product [Effrenium voratum]